LTRSSLDKSANISAIFAENGELISATITSKARRQQAYIR
jgi:hypothetical protein